MMSYPPLSLLCSWNNDCLSIFTTVCNNKAVRVLHQLQKQSLVEVWFINSLYKYVIYVTMIKRNVKRTICCILTHKYKYNKYNRYKYLNNSDQCVFRCQINLLWEIWFVCLFHVIYVTFTTLESIYHFNLAIVNCTGLLVLYLSQMSVHDEQIRI